MPKKKVTKTKKVAATERVPSRMEQLKAMMGTINRELEDGHVYLGTDHPPVQRIPTGIDTLDVLTGGGYPKGMLTELHGEESSGKSLAMLLAIAETQRNGGLAAGFFREGFDAAWARKLGVNVDKLIMVDVGMGDTSMEVAMTMFESGLIDLLALDSFQSFGTATEASAGIEKQAYGGGGSSQMWGRVMRRAYAAMNQGGSNTAILGISQVRSAIGKWSPTGTPEPEPIQARSILHWKSIALQFKKGELRYTEKDKSEHRKIVSRTFNVRCVKNKTATPERVGKFSFYFLPWAESGGSGKGAWSSEIEPGLDVPDMLFNLARGYDLLEQRGANLEGYGIEASSAAQFLAILREHEDIQEAIRADIREALVER
jgi:recombination protein RecA